MNEWKKKLFVSRATPTLAVVAVLITLFTFWD
ncbi:hypothetical protein J2T15_003320 [Paenibacillus harenae]|uniref:Uncharacterized protein n=1 Tax=Paenibacillus harenae TaxID=306543 RepID=A0ABT9U3R3_PAEHA|nr:hypothetical protein [Paenibacillus harenae]MDQ0113877.1 hypothetical protein [Paenibacillus harenae]